MDVLSENDEVQHQYCVCGLACLVLKQMLKKNSYQCKKHFKTASLKNMCGLYIEFLTIKKINCWQVGPEGYRDVTATKKSALIFLYRTTPQKLFKKNLHFIPEIKCLRHSCQSE